jgi:hypothetical protein
MGTFLKPWKCFLLPSCEDPADAVATKTEARGISLLKSMTNVNDLGEAVVVSLGARRFSPSEGRLFSQDGGIQNSHVLEKETASAATQQVCM